MVCLPLQHKETIFNKIGVDEYMWNSVRFLSFIDNLNDGY